MSIASTTPQTLVRQPIREGSARLSYARDRRRLEAGLMAGVPVFLILLWETAARLNWIDKAFYPAPSMIVNQTVILLENGRLAKDIAATLRVAFSGYVIGAVLGFVIGVLMGLSRTLRAALEPTLTALYVVPKLALLPIFLTIAGFGEAPKVILVAVTVFFFCWIAAMEAAASVPQGYRDAARSFGVTRWQMFYHVILPATLPELFVGLRIATGVAILVVVGAEFVVGNSGLGYLIFNSRALLMISWSYTGIAVVAILGVLFAWLITRLGAYVTPWSSGAGAKRPGR